MRKRLWIIAGGLALNASALAAEPPAAVTADPPPDKAHPAGQTAFALPTHDVKINALLFTAAGTGPHPAVLLLQGVPGNDSNADLARAIQRAGWHVLTIKYRGSFGSPGRYSFTHCLEDAAAAVEWLRTPDNAAHFGIDPSRIVVVGHSMGGFLAGWLAGHDDRLAGAALISPGRSFGALPADISRADVVQRMENNLLNDQGMHTVGDATATELADEVIHNNKNWDLSRFAPEIAKHPLLVVTSDDGGAPANERVAAAVKAQRGASVQLIHFQTDHGYDDHRIALATTIVTWLQQLPSGR